MNVSRSYVSIIRIEFWLHQNVTFDVFHLNFLWRVHILWRWLPSTFSFVFHFGHLKISKRSWPTKLGAISPTNMSCLLLQESVKSMGGEGVGCSKNVSMPRFEPVQTESSNPLDRGYPFGHRLSCIPHFWVEYKLMKFACKIYGQSVPQIRTRTDSVFKSVRQPSQPLGRGTIAVSPWSSFLR